MNIEGGMHKKRIRPASWSADHGIHSSTTSTRMRTTSSSSEHMRKMKTNGTLNDDIKTMEKSMFVQCVKTLAELGRFGCLSA